MPRLIEDERLQLEFTFQSLTRGLRYFQSGRVSGLESADGGSAIVGRVDGTRDDPYEVPVVGGAAGGGSAVLWGV